MKKLPWLKEKCLSETAHAVSVVIISRDTRTGMLLADLGMLIETTASTRFGANTAVAWAITAPDNYAHAQKTPTDNY